MIKYSYENYLRFLINEKFILSSLLGHRLQKLSRTNNITISLLDAGCGNGIITTFLSPIVEKIVAIDCNPMLFSLCKKKVNKLHLTNVEVLLGDWMELKRKEQFNTYLFSHSLYHITDHAVFLHHIKRLGKGLVKVFLTLRSLASVPAELMKKFWPFIYKTSVPKNYFVEWHKKQISSFGIHQELTYYNSNILFLKEEAAELLYFIFSSPRNGISDELIKCMKDWLLLRLEKKGNYLYLPTYSGLLTLDIQIV